MHDFLVVGSGLFGAVFAHEAKKKNKKVLVIDSRNHIGGNVYTENIKGINVHKYGPHIFHTSSKKIWDYVNQFASFNHFVNHAKSFYKGKLYSLPINMNTFHEIAGCITPADAQKYLEENRLKCTPTNAEEWILSQVGKEIYEILIKGYTIKQWKRHPKDLPASILRRLPIRLTYDNNYYNDPYQGIPIGGYTQIIEKLLDGIDVRLGVDFFSRTAPLEWPKYAKRLVYTGRIDQFYNYCYGELEYRTLEFEHLELEGDYQGNAIIAHPEESVPYTRIVEHKHFEFGKQKNTVITKEYPTEWHKEKTPYYPINDDKNNKIYSKYKQIQNNVIIGGRLGNYQYYDMDQTIANALMTVQKHL
jgi:UDP-galactopyranose mutase